MFNLILNLVLGGVEPHNFRYSNLQPLITGKSGRIGKGKVLICDFSKCSPAPEIKTTAVGALLAIGSSASSVASLELRKIKMAEEHSAVRDRRTKMTGDKEFLLRNPEYNTNVEVRLLVAYLKTHFKGFKFMCRTECSIRFTLLAQGNSAYASSDYIIRFRSLVENLDRGSGTKLLETALSHVFFYTPQQVLDLIRRVVDDKVVFDNDDNARKYVLGGPGCWRDRLCKHLKKYVDEEKEMKRAFKQQSGISPGLNKSTPSLPPSSTTSSMWRHCDYNLDSLFDLLRLIRNVDSHYQEIQGRAPKNEIEKNMLSAVGTKPESFLRYFTLRYPALVTVVWINAHQKRQMREESDINVVHLSTTYANFGKSEVNE